MTVTDLGYWKAPVEDVFRDFDPELVQCPDCGIVGSHTLAACRAKSGRTAEATLRESDVGEGPKQKVAKEMAQELDSRTETVELPRPGPEVQADRISGVSDALGTFLVEAEPISRTRAMPEGKGGKEEAATGNTPFISGATGLRASLGAAQGGAAGSIIGTINTDIN